MHSDQVFYFRLINVFKMFQFFFVHVQSLTIRLRRHWELLFLAEAG